MYEFVMKRRKTELKRETSLRGNYLWDIRIKSHMAGLLALGSKVIFSQNRNQSSLVQYDK